MANLFAARRKLLCLLLLRIRLMVGRQILDLSIGVRIPDPQPKFQFPTQT